MHKVQKGYKAVSDDSSVDENLFGKKKTRKVQGESKSPLRQHNSKSTEDTMVIRQTDLKRMMQPSPIMSALQIEQIRQEQEAQKQVQRAHAQARKEKMLALEEQRKKQQPETETQRLQRLKDQAIREAAKEKLDDQIDQVKIMNQMVQYSQCATIRDAQREERKHILQEEEMRNRKLDLQMEIQRQQAIENYEQRERQRQEQRKEGAKVIAQQIQQRQQRQLEEEEQQEIERKQVQREIQRLQQEEKQQLIEKQKAAKALLDEVALVNQEQVERKKQLKIKQEEEDMQILAYLKQKEKHEQALQDEKSRIAKQKELEVARLRAQQEKAADKQAEIDELRARRYQEEIECKYREQELQRQIKQKAVQEDLDRARQHQQEAKLRQKAEMAKFEFEDFQRILKANIEKQAAEERQYELGSIKSTHGNNDEKEEFQKQISQKIKDDLLAQIAMHKEKQNFEYQLKREEGRTIKDLNTKQGLLLEQIKQQKVRDLRESGVPEQYITKLAKFRVNQGFEGTE